VYNSNTGYTLALPTCATQLTQTKTSGSFTINPGDSVEIIWTDSLT
jgi:hypothetical protein